DTVTPRGVGERVTLACLWEAIAAKPGNVYRGADFDDMTFADMATSAVAIGAAVQARCGAGSLGGVALGSVQAMRAATGKNTHLGTILLLAPLAIASSRGGDTLRGAAELVRTASADDARGVYEAIRTAAPGGLGRVPRGDVAGEPTIGLLEAMQLAADRDLIARQYTNGFEHVAAVAESISTRNQGGRSLHDAVVAAYVELMAREPDSLIARKCGPGVAKESADRAAAVIAAGGIGSDAYNAALADLDFWLRADGHRRNPGTTADVIAAALFVLLSEGRIDLPLTFYG
ncbi:MAG: triphosphoribosyl-dephospho-CoA synthase, partial [Planctomycetota bacterium]